MRISIDKHNLVPNRIVAGLMHIDVFTSGEGLGTGEPYIPVMVFDPLLHSSPLFSGVDFIALARNPQDNATLFSRVDGVFWSHKV